MLLVPVTPATQFWTQSNNEYNENVNRMIKASTLERMSVSTVVYLRLYREWRLHMNSYDVKRGIIPKKQ